LLAVFLEILARRPKFQALDSALPVVWLTGAISALVTVALGYMHSAEGGFDSSAVDLHRWSGSLLVLVAFMIWVWRTESPTTYAKAWPIGAVAVTTLLFATGHFGGNLTHGSTFLAQYAPEPLRTWAGVPPEAAPRPAVTDSAMADIYLDVVAPSLRNRCATCHNDDKHRGSLSVASYAKLLKGGKSGPAIVAGQPAKSELFRRINLPHDHADFMPKDGKTPLTAKETVLIEWWISVGAPQSGTLAELKAPAAIQTTVGDVLGLSSAVSKSAAASGSPTAGS
jgi:hypothetical protein